MNGDIDLSTAELHGALADPALNSMNFLNEVSRHYPEAISLAAGRPAEEFFDLEDLRHSERRPPGNRRGGRRPAEAVRPRVRSCG